MRNRYLDLLRAAAIVRVVVYHLFGWPWLSILLPAIGIMFALAGSLTAASLDKRPAAQVITSRLRRLLPPLWLLAAIAVPAMLYLGWTGEKGGDEPLSWKLGLWLLPIGDPPGSERGIAVWETLWYIRAYLWFVVLSPLMYLAYKKIGWAAVAAPVVLIAVLDKTDLTLPFGRADAAMWDFATYGACWMAGFAHHDGRLARIRPGLVVAVAAILGLAALYWLNGHASEDGWDLNDVSESQALWSLAFVLVALRWQPDMTWLRRSPRLDGMVNLLNARAVTIYLWHNIAIAAIWPVLTVLALDDLGALDGPTDLAASLALTMVAVLAFGWVEDLAARRRPSLWPTGGPRGAAPSSAAPVGETPAADAAGSNSRPADDLWPGGGPGSAEFGSRPTGDLRPAGAPGAAGFGVGPTGDLRPAGEVDAAGLGSRPTGDLRPAGGVDAAGLGSRPTGDLRPGGRVDAARSTGVPGFGAAGRADSARDGEFRDVRGAGLPVAGGPVKQAPWSGGAAAPIVVGESGFVARQRRGYVAPFPEAEVSFGLPDAGPRASGSGPLGPVAPAGPVAPGGPVGPVTHPGPVGPEAHPGSAGVAGVVTPAGPEGPGGTATPAGPVGPPAQARRYGSDGREAAVPWFGGENDGQR